jgi:hypothetical protein
VSANTTNEDICRALADQVKAGVQADTNVVWYDLDDEDEDVPPPRICVRLEEWAYVTTMGANGTADLRGVLVGRVPLPVSNPAENASRTVLAYLDPVSPTSVAQAVMSDRTLGGVVGDCVALNATRTSKTTFEVPFEIIQRKTGAIV